MVPFLVGYHQLTQILIACPPTRRDAAFCLLIHVGLSLLTISRCTSDRFPDARALVRLQCDHIGKTIVTTFYRFLQAQEEAAQIQLAKDFTASLETLVALFERAEHEIVQGGGASGIGEQKALSAGLGLWHENGDLSLSDIMVGPCSFSPFSMSLC